MGSAVYVQDGKIINYKNTGAEVIPFGSTVILTERIGVATFDIQPGTLGTLELSGVYEMDAENTAAFAVGQTLYWDDANKCLTATKAEDSPVTAGFAVEVKAQTQTRALVRI